MSDKRISPRQINRIAAADGAGTAPDGLTPDREPAYPWLAGVALLIGAVVCVLWYQTQPRLMPRPRMGIQSALWSDLATQGGVVALATILAWMPASRRLLLAAYERVRQPSRGARAATALLLGIGVAIYCYANAILQQRSLLPFWHDEEMYRLQSQMLAHGHLWLPAHPLARFFESFYLFTTPVYAPIYFPGTALLHVPGVWLGLPYSAIPLFVAGASAALLYLVITQLTDGVCGMLAVLLLIASPVFRVLSVMEMSHAAMMLWGLLIAWAWLCWRQSGHVRWIWLAGAVAGWAAITRPIDAACVVGPIAVGWGRDLIRRKPSGYFFKAALIAGVASLPFIAILLTLDYRVTGNIFHSALGAYDLRYFGIEGLGFHHNLDPEFRPPAAVPQFRLLYESFLRPAMVAYTPAYAVHEFFCDRLPTVVNASIGSSFLLALLPLGVLGLKTGPRLALAAIAPLFMLTMSLYFSFLDHYSPPIIPWVILLILLGARAIERALPAGGKTAAAWPAAIFGLALLGLPGISGRIEYSTCTWATMEMNYGYIPENVQRPAIVLFRSNNLVSFHEEPVYNWDVAWPDDAPIIRAHDLGDKENQQLFRYYAARQPDRKVYRFDLANFQLRWLGTVKELAAN